MVYDFLLRVSSLSSDIFAHCLGYDVTDSVTRLVLETRVVLEVLRYLCCYFCSRVESIECRSGFITLRAS